MTEAATRLRESTHVRTRSIVVISGAPVTHARPGDPIHFHNQADDIRYRLWIHMQRSTRLQASLRLNEVDKGTVEHPDVRATVHITPTAGANSDAWEKLRAIQGKIDYALRGWEKAGRVEFGSIAWFAQEYMPKRRVRRKRA